MAEPVTDGDDDGIQGKHPAFDFGTSSSRFSLPDGWIVHHVPRRSNAPRFYQFYIEPETGRKFKSKDKVKRYLNGKEDRTKMTPENKGGTSKFTLPEGWFVKKLPRKGGPVIDKLYEDPKTGRLLRSLKEVERYVRDGIMPIKSCSKRVNCNEKMTPKGKGDTSNFILPEGRFVRKQPCKSGSRIDEMTPKGKGGTSNLTLPEGRFVRKRPCKSGLRIEEMTPKGKRGTSNFTLPEGWLVRKCPRKSGSRIDKYYEDPETGRLFRSLLDVERYIKDGCVPTTKRVNFNQKVLVCETCGDVGFTNAFIYCVKCLGFVVHRYCLDVMPRTFDEFVPWLCQACKPLPYPPKLNPSSFQNKHAYTTTHIKREEVVEPMEPGCESGHSWLKEAPMKSESGHHHMCPSVVCWF